MTPTNTHSAEERGHFWECSRPETGAGRSGSECSLDGAKCAAENAARDLGYKGLIVTITKPRGGKLWLVPKERTSGMKWESRP